MYWVMSTKDSLVLATTMIKEVAEIIAKTFPEEECFIRWGDMYDAKPYATIKESRHEA